MKKQFLKLLRDNRGAAVVEYGLVVAGVALISSAAISLLGHETNDLLATMAAVLPGAHADDNGPILSGRLIETVGADVGDIALDVQGIADGANSARLETNLGIPTGTLGGLVLDEPTP